MKDQLKRMFLETLDELAIEGVFRRKLRVEGGTLEIGDERLELDGFKKILAVAIGKAAHEMAEAFAKAVEPATVSGVVISSVERRPPPRFVGYHGGHPYPNSESVRSALVLEEFLDDLKPNYLVVYLLSGGGSAVCEAPVDPAIGLDELREFYRLLVTCGADIVQMNTLRKHLSAVKGGRLAAWAQPARQATLYISDVPAGRASTVASGPTMPDESTLADCEALLDELELRPRLPASYRRLFDEKRVPETPKPGDPAFENCSWHALLDNGDAVEALRRRAEAAGWTAAVDLSMDDRPVAEAADRLLARLEELRQEHPGRPAAVITGGELSSPVLGDGRGGRNLAFVLDCVPKIAGRPIAVLSAGTDGVDGNSPAAGAAADGKTLSRAQEMGLDPIDFYRRSDSFTFFERLDEAIVTGPTGNNVRDVRVLAAQP